jgi:hypothetical protein
MLRRSSQQLLGQLQQLQQLPAVGNAVQFSSSSEVISATLFPGKCAMPPRCRAAQPLRRLYCAHAMRDHAVLKRLRQSASAHAAAAMTRRHCPPARPRGV